MSKMFQEQKPRLLFFTFNGDYGGDKYENWLFELLSTKMPILKVSENRLGGFRTVKSLLKLLIRGYSPSANGVVRPFGLPVFRRNMLVIFHHFDHTGVPWYTKVIESVDMFGLKICARLFGTRFLVVSRHWGDWLRSKGFSVDYLVYNQVTLADGSNDEQTRRYLSEKYGLDPAAKWVFLGGDQWKKGGRSFLAKWRLQKGESQDFQFIFSGKRRSDNEAMDARVIWIDNDDYSNFLRQLHAVVANSLFEEGWCRVVHEAVLGGVPAIGSGRGGMAELLNMAGYSALSSEAEMVDFVASPPTVVATKMEDVADTIERNNEAQLSAVVAYLQKCT